VGKLTAANAKQVLRQAGFRVRAGEPVVDDNVLAGEVVSTSPSGRALPGATITLTLSQGPRMIAVPPVPAGDTVAQAEALLRAAGLTVAPVTKKVGAASDPVIGAVAGTSPGAGTSWPENKPVTVNVVAGLTLPDLVGQIVGAIQGWAGQNHVSIKATQVSSSQPQGTIVAQSPGPSTPVQPGQAVTVSVSSGPAKVPVPNVKGGGCQQAQQELQQSGFSVQVQQGTFRADTVTGVSPTGQAPSGTVITLQCGSANPF
jgi:serine/threonine-protein kinase